MSRRGGSGGGVGGVEGIHEMVQFALAVASEGGGGGGGGLIHSPETNQSVLGLSLGGGSDVMGEPMNAASVTSLGGSVENGTPSPPPHTHTHPLTLLPTHPPTTHTPHTHPHTHPIQMPT